MSKMREALGVRREATRPADVFVFVVSCVCAVVLFF